MTEPLTPKSKHVALAQRVTTLEQAGGGGGAAPAAGALSDAFYAGIQLPGSTAPVLVSRVLLTPTADLIGPGSYVGLSLQGAIGLNAQNVQVEMLTLRAAIPIEVTGVTEEGGFALIHTPPFLFGYNGDHVRVTLTPPISLPSANGAVLSTLSAEVRDENGVVLPGVLVGANLTPTPVVAAPGPIGPSAMPVVRRPSGYAFREGHTELVLEAGQVPVLRVFHQGEWYGIPMALESAGGPPV